MEKALACDRLLQAAGKEPVSPLLLRYNSLNCSRKAAVVHSKGALGGNLVLSPCRGFLLTCLPFWTAAMLQILCSMHPCANCCTDGMCRMGISDSQHFITNMNASASWPPGCIFYMRAYDVQQQL